jgi:phosphate transport system substrate-binding protein
MNRQADGRDILGHHDISESDVRMTAFSHHARRLRRCLLSAAFVSLGLLTLPSAAVQAAGVTLDETGSTLLYPLFKLWISDYAHVAPDVVLTAAGTGSGAGIEAAISGKVRMGASDAYMSDEQTQQNREIVNIPLAISAQTVNYNIPGLNQAGLKLDGPTLAGIYAGKITEWDAGAIAALNPGVQLPHQTIVPIRRADASGDTFVFTQFLDFSTQTWEDKIGYGTSVAWPSVASERTAAGNDGMVDTAAATPYSVAYIGISFHDAIAKAGLGTALIENQSGKFLLPTPETIDAGASVLDPRTPPDERLSLVYAPGEKSYPLINYEYAVISKKQADPETAAALRRFLRWAISLEGGNAPKYLEAVGFIPLPDFIRALSQNQITLIK